MGNPKRDHPVHYWTRLLLASWMILSLVMVGIVNGAVTHTTVDTMDNSGMTHVGPKYFGRAVNGTWLYIHTSDDFGLYLSKSYDNGTSWDTEEIVSTTWKGHTTLFPIGVHTTWNNTTIIIFQTIGADSVNDAYMAVNYSGSWLIENIYSSVPYAWSYVTTAVNYSCVGITFMKNAQARYIVWDWINISVVSNDILMYSYSGARPQITVNQSGQFWAVHTNWDGSYYDFHFRTLDDSVNFKQENVFNLAVPYIQGFEALPNNYFAWFYGLKYTVTSYIYFNKALYDGTGQAKIKLKQTTDDLGFASGGGLTFTSSNQCYCYMGSYDDDEILYWTAQYDAIEVTWQTSETVLFNALGADDSIAGKSSTSLYPRDPDGNYTVVPTSGFTFAYLWKEELGSPDDYHYRLSWDVIYPVYTPPPEPPDDDDDDDDEEPEALVDVQCVSGGLIALCIVIFLMTIAVVAFESAR